jgi:hypothetical protein
LSLACAIGCNVDEGRGNNGHGGNDAGAGGGGGDDGGGGGGGGGLDDGGVFQNPDGMTVVMDPVTCADAAANKSYIGCDYWPTVVANVVWSTFDFAVVVSNPGMNPATVTVTGPNNVNQMVTVMPGSLEKIFLPWVPELKGADADECGGSPNPPSASVSKTGGAYHLVSSVPVLVYQFNALEYAPQGGPTGKDWSKCPGTVTKCAQNNNTAIGCFSYSNDASLLMPSTAMTGNYRVVGWHGFDGNAGLPPLIPASPGMPSYIAITATQANTTVKLQVSSTGKVIAGASGSNIAAIAGGGTASYTMNAGDVIELFTDQSATTDLSGSLVQADKPVQVIGGVPCVANPSAACDHIEQSIQPAETLGSHYVVNMPTGPHDTSVGATVRLVGNVNNTTLTFTPAVSGAPATLNAGQVAEFDASSDFVVQGDHEFIVGIIMKSGSVVDPMPITSTAPSKGDPSLSTITAVEQYRLKYVFLAPDDYDLNYADVVAPMNAMLMLDGKKVNANPTQVGSTGYGVYRIKLTSGANMGTHTLTSDQPVGVQVLGYGSYTSYQYPAGLDLLSIAPPPPPIS